MHRRTLSRRLKDGGMGYRAITNEIRFEIARQLLEDTEVPLGADRGGSGLFGGQRLHPGLPALVGPDADRLADPRPRRGWTRVPTLAHAKAPQPIASIPVPGGTIRSPTVILQG